ncbi:ABC transporter ATP-binding protein [Histidinibacterium lentulum]|uniref:ABC transporter ATP-binding protein n=2 Tax=Histidinibacterium lentulum TaxID=2480588 RepID=A0A3N2R5V2_9RHOB|nr:ABC transporter ATP-binding protein [Histidinibacterium lentulum]
MAAVELRDLHKTFGAYTALERLNLEIEDGEFLVLLGPSGCGKSTTMRLIAGLEEPSSGDILIGGKRVNDTPPRDRDLAMVFQNYALYPHMTVAENIGYPLKVARVPRTARADRVRAAAAKVEMAHLLDRRPGELSGGQRQRVALARAIVRTPRLFLMDEPLSNLDAKLRTVMRAELRHLQKELATTTIYVTHDQVEAMTLADRIVILNDARIQQIGTPKEVYERPANTFVAGFIGGPPMTLIPGTVTADRFTHETGALDLPGQPDGPAIIGARPEDIRVTAPGAGDLDGTVFSSELLGDATLLTVRVGPALVAVKVGPDDGRDMDAPVGLSLDRAKLHVFDGQTGQRRD